MNLSTTTVLAIVLLGLLLLILGRLSALQRRLDLLSRVEAKIDALLGHAGVTFDPHREVDASVVEALRRGEKINAIKQYRSVSGVGLKEAKDYVEEIQRREGLQNLK